MQKFLKVFAVLLLLFVVGGLLLDNEFEVKREVVIDAPVEVVHAYVNDLEQWQKWSPWQQLDQTVVTTVGDITQGVGASQTWTDQNGGGSLKLTHASVTEGIQYDLKFAGDDTVFISKMAYDVQGSKTKVSWSMSGKMQPIIIGNYFAQLMDTLVGDSFALGLNNLKQVVENG
jgi:uncharacterized protein YndB with AHSA1/START domain